MGRICQGPGPGSAPGSGCHILPSRVRTNRNSCEDVGLRGRQDGGFYFASKALHLVRPRFLQGQTASRWQCPIYLTREFQPKPNACCTTPQRRAPTHTPGGQGQAEERTHTGWTREMQQHRINGNKTSCGWGSGRKSRMAWDTGHPLTRCPAAPGITPRVIFPRCPAGPRVQGPGSGPGAALNASKSTRRRTLQWCGVGSRWTSHSL